MEPDFSGPYIITSVCGKLVNLKNQEGASLKSKISISHLKPYKRSNNGLRSESTQQADNGSRRQSVIYFTPRTVPMVQENSTLDHVPKPRSTQEEVLRLWSSKDLGRVEAVVGPYKLYSSSFRTLQVDGWLADEVIDAYLYHLIEAHKMPVYHLSAVVASALFAGQFRCLSKIVTMSKMALKVVDPMGQESALERKIRRNWKNFLKTLDHKDHSAEWHVLSMKHNLQQDSSSCGVLVLKFSEAFLLTGDISKLETTHAAISSARMDIACTLLECRGNAEDYCIVCSMLESDSDKSVIEMVQCELCGRWAHFECAQYQKDKDTKYYCTGCLAH
ncbi:uncharacterized protein LOC111196181 isoform X2 [Astyanax mexicanus]|uniref:uncharacterized protein LOC111196181 isoform X2 n=1 Tax=Astyanax mexicanus TaxID=7994 RepID=UPI0020CB40A4|nr:uncharacterized protein LOC111196181 isoform X2 [Astyanax mexicanus]